MGCDEHLFIEVRDPLRERWVVVPPEPTDEDWSHLPGVDGWIPSFEERNAWDLGRNYGAYAQLADVRADDDDPPPWFQARGIPDDLSSELCGAHAVSECLGEHSFTWGTLAEMRAHAARSAVVHERITDLIAVMEEICATYRLDAGDVRFVVGFDS